MNQLTDRAVTVISLVILGFVLSASDAVAQSAKSQLVGAWTLVAAESVRADGSKVGVSVLGSNPKGTMMFSSEGHFALIQMRADLPKLASNCRAAGTSE